MRRFNFREIQLQQLQIPTGWNVVCHQFYDVEPDSSIFNIQVKGLLNENIWELFIEDLLQLQNSQYNLILDLGWYPEGDPNGCYKLILIQHQDWEAPLATYQSKKKDEIVNKINLWLSNINPQ
ncbi:hypothetical protein [Gloeothece verrucosa]|uniref:Uncharacterized protein n=1 Tax=Gloeothece verrucosa (strain PCC 7822) TaxID=497965 RepID=E0UGP7_GLOV7|nr:hypothetical protein [Gloeothece verrucosa]ADN13256.1 conserved hypothetical protein [Gloeothece verrucosa PCC 7822]